MAKQTKQPKPLLDQLKAIRDSRVKIVELAKQAFDRADKLVKMAAGSQSDKDQAEIALEVAKCNLAEAELAILKVQSPDS